jgi:ubiquinone/menaquinone biosynthesis C-methylase UbiE
MANQEHWNVKDEREMWLKVVGKEKEDRLETILQANKIFAGLATHGAHACLEIGCGSGRFASFAVFYFSRYVGIDSSKSILSYVPYKTSETMDFIRTTGTYIPFENKFFDFVFSFTCFQHMPTLEMVRENLKEAYRVLCPGGLCRIQTVQGDYLDCGRYDGVVFPTIHDFTEEFKAVGFKIKDARLDGEWIWVTAQK